MMKTENERLKEIFAKNLGQRRDTPDFELMWQKASERNRKNGLLVWRIAAGVALVVTFGTLFMVNRQKSRKDNGTHPHRQRKDSAHLAQAARLSG